ncbi:MAG: hypothetical protein JO203_15970 [Gammaproteobacteria bacterium]|nr:hypothetical protein [Gammaproteobacteria bacterium]
MPALSAGPFVLNLCSSTSPMALAQTDLPELRRFHFVVGRGFEEGRERFRLHVGYFATLAEAEEWLGVVREIYPGAWAGETPGRKLRERAAAAAAAQAQHAAGPQSQLPASAPRAPAAPAQRPAPRPTVSAPAPTRVPVVHAAPPVARSAPSLNTPPAGAPPVAPRARQATPPPAPQPPPFPPPTPAARTAPALQGAAVARPAAKAPPAAPRPAPPPPAAAPVARPAAAPANRAPASPAAARPPAPVTAEAAAKPAKPAVKPVFEDSNVREVLKALGDASATGETRLMRAPPAPPVREPATVGSSLSDTQVLKMLETRRSEESEGGPAAVDDSGIPLLKPDDTGTRQALKEAIVSNSSVAFAVQLQWSVQPVELDKVPPLAIFSAYTLYTVEGSRDGRRWYGLRLGFFSDAISAKQVAYYVRSEFSSVAVVPVSPQEKSRATDQDAAAALAAPVAARPDPMDEFKLIDDEPAQLPKPGPKPATPPPRTAAGAPAPKVAVGRTVVQPSAPPGRPRVRNARVPARETRGPQTLEETLEILGASQLSVDDGRAASINDSGVRHLRVEVTRNSPFSKLLERLSERLKKP